MLLSTVKQILTMKIYILYFLTNKLSSEFRVMSSEFRKIDWSLEFKIQSYEFGV